MEVSSIDLMKSKLQMIGKNVTLSNDFGFIYEKDRNNKDFGLFLKDGDKAREVDIEISGYRVSEYFIFTSRHRGYANGLFVKGITSSLIPDGMSIKAHTNANVMLYEESLNYPYDGLVILHYNSVYKLINYKGDCLEIWTNTPISARIGFDTEHTSRYFVEYATRTRNSLNVLLSVDIDLASIDVKKPNKIERIRRIDIVNDRVLYEVK